MAARKQIFVPNNPSAPRLCPELAAEIGLTESVLLLQLEFWIRTSTAERREGEQWTYQSLADIQETFTFWSKETIRRGLTHLERLGLIRIGVFNRTEWDRTKWYALNLEGVARLQSIRLVDSDAIQADKVPISQNEKSISQIDYIEHNKMRNGTQQNETTIPETTTETTTENNQVSSFAQSQKKPKAAAPKTAKPKKESDPRVPEVLKAIAELYNDEIPVYAQQAKYTKDLLKKYEPETIVACWKWKWEHKDQCWVDMYLVVKDIADWKAGRLLGQKGNGYGGRTQGISRGQRGRTEYDFTGVDESLD